MHVIQVPLLYEDLWKEARNRNRKQRLAEISNQDWRTFQIYESSDNHLRVEDKRGHLLAYRFRIPEQYLQTLMDTKTLIPKRKIETHRRDTTSHRYWRH